MKKVIFIWTICLLGVMLPVKLFAQSDLQINKAFEKYGRNKDVVMVELSEDVLKSYNLKLYKSISIKNDVSAVDFIRRCLKSDQEGAKKSKQVLKSGELSSLYLQLQKRGSENRYILFRTDQETGATLIYIETAIETDNIVNLLLKKNQ